MIADTATARVQWTARCCQAGCANPVSVWPHCPMHGGWSHFNQVLASAPSFEWSAFFAAMRGEFVQARARA